MYFMMCTIHTVVVHQYVALLGSSHAWCMYMYTDRKKVGVHMKGNCKYSSRTYVQYVVWIRGKLRPFIKQAMHNRTSCTCTCARHVMQLDCTRESIYTQILCNLASALEFFLSKKWVSLLWYDSVGLYDCKIP